MFQKLFRYCAVALSLIGSAQNGLAAEEAGDDETLRVFIFAGQSNMVGSGTLGQLEHGVNYADAYLRTIGQTAENPRPLKTWPYKKGSRVKLFVLAGHRNMEGERAFVQELRNLTSKASLLNDNPKIG